MDRQRTCRASRWTDSVHAGLGGGQAGYLLTCSLDCHGKLGPAGNFGQGGHLPILNPNPPPTLLP